MSFKFLLVDDESSYTEAMAQRLEQRGYNVVAAFSGPEALDILEQNDTIDVVVLDVNMPEQSGIETLSAIKKEYPLVEVIMLTAQATISTAIETLKLGAYDYVAKPCDVQALIDKATPAAIRKKEREEKIRDIKTTPYITAHERDKRIADVLEG